MVKKSSHEAIKDVQHILIKWIYTVWDKKMSCTKNREGQRKEKASLNKMCSWCCDNHNKIELIKWSYFTHIKAIED